MSKSLLFKQLFTLIFTSLFASLWCVSFDVLAQENNAKQPITETTSSEKVYSEQTWGVGFFVRNSEIPFDTESDNVTSVVPMMFYEGETFYIRGTEGGAHLYQHNDWQLNVMGRMRFFDIPAEYQNEVQGDSIDLGVQWRKDVSNSSYIDAEIFSDFYGNYYANLSQSWYIKHNQWEFMPKVTARYKTASFNSRYFALEELTNERIGSGIEFNAKLETRYHVSTNFYLLGSIGATLLDNNAYQSDAIEQKFQGEMFLGFAFFNDISKPKKAPLNNHGYVRIAHGWATPSNIGEIISGDTEKDEYNNQLTSVFYGIPLTDELFSWPLDIYITPGFVWHWNSEVQDSEQEVVLAIKGYYTAQWPVRVRFGVAEGLSYISNVTYIERTELEKKGYRPSELLNYLDFSVDVNVGDLFNQPQLSDVWLGYSIHHRSAIFESASQFGRIKGGSNYNTVYVQFNF